MVDNPNENLMHVNWYNIFNNYGEAAETWYTEEINQLKTAKGLFLAM